MKLLPAVLATLALFGSGSTQATFGRHQSYAIHDQALGAEAQTRHSGPQDEVERLRAHNRNYGKWVRKLQRENRQLRRLSVVGYQVRTAIKLGAVAYGQSPSTLLRKAECESHLWPFARNPSGATGLFQFLGSTWRSTPFAAFSIWDPFAQALAAAWMHWVGRGNEWSCR